MKLVDVEPIIEDLLELKACSRECVTIDGMIESLMALPEMIYPDRRQTGAV